MVVLFLCWFLCVLHKESTVTDRVAHEGACYEIANADAGKIMSSTPGVLVSGTEVNEFLVKFT